MPAPAPQTIAAEVNQDIVALGCVPVRERQEFMFLRKKQKIEKKIADLKKADAGEAFAMEMKLSAALRKRPINPILFALHPVDSVHFQGNRALRSSSVLASGSSSKTLHR